MKKIVMTAFVLLISCIGVYGQHSIKGTILEGMSKQPLKEVLIQVKKGILEIKLEGYATQNILIERSETLLDLGIIVYLILKSVFFQTLLCLVFLFSYSFKFIIS